MKQKTFKVFLTLIISLLLTLFAVLPMSVYGDAEYGLAIQLNESNGDLSDSITFTLDDYVTNCDHHKQTLVKRQRALIVGILLM